jgi:HupE / UreJ protein
MRPLREGRISPRRIAPGGVAALAVGLVLATPALTSAHDIPARVAILAFVKPEGQTLHLLVRVPLESIRDVEFPLRGPGYLDIDRVGPMLRDAAQLWIADYLELYEGDSLLANARLIGTRVSLPSDRSFSSYDAAHVHLIAPPLPPGTDLMWNQAMLDVEFEYPIGSPQSRFSIRPALAHLGVRTSTVLRFLPPGRGERDFEYLGDPGLVRLDPEWYQAARRFISLGFFHILDGIDHLLFVFCLVIPFRRIRPLIAVVTSFTAAHSITLFASALGFAPTGLWFPPLIEALIALSIVYMALENIVGPKLQRRWIVAFGFGLVHGFGFSFILRASMQFAGSHLAASLVAFNVGVELGQVFVLALAIPALNAFFRFVVAERMGTILLSALVAHTAWHWMLDRIAILKQYEFQWPTFDRALVADVLRVLMAVLILSGVLRVLYLLYGRLLRPARQPEPGAAGESPVAS